MLNQFKMHMNTLVRRKYVYVVGVIFFIMPFLSALMNSFILDTNKHDTLKSLGVDSLESMFAGDISSSFIGLIAGIMAAIYFTRMLSTGFIKNIASTVKKRSSIASSIVCAFTLISIGYILCSMIGTIIAYNVIYKCGVPIGSMTNLPMYFLYNLLFVIASIVFSVTVAVVTKSNNASILVIIVVNFFSDTVLGMANTILPFNILNYSMWHDYGNATVTYSDQWISGIISTLIILIIGGLISKYVLNKKDLI